MKKILLLGAFGFIGTNILKYIDNFLIEEYQVIAFDRVPYHLDNINFNCITKTYAGDFSDKYLIEKIFEDNHIELVIHSLSASIPSSSIDNIFDLQCNVIPTINLLDIMSHHKVDKMVFISSGGAIYGDHHVGEKGHSEEEVLFPKSAYGVAKLVIEKFLYLYNIQYGLESLVLRLSNPYGPYHYSKKQGIINIALEKAIKGERFQVWGDGKGRKDYIYIEDFCHILFKLLKHEWQPYKVLNIGSGELLSINQIVHYVKNLYPSFSWEYKDSNTLDVKDVKLNINMLHQSENIRFTSIKEGLEKTNDWYKDIKNHNL